MFLPPNLNNHFPTNGGANARSGPQSVFSSFSAALFIVQILAVPAAILFSGNVATEFLADRFGTQDNLIGYGSFAVSGLVLGFMLQSAAPGAIKSGGLWVWVLPTGVLLYACVYGIITLPSDLLFDFLASAPLAGTTVGFCDLAGGRMLVLWIRNPYGAFPALPENHATGALRPPSELVLRHRTQQRPKRAIWQPQRRGKGRLFGSHSRKVIQEVTGQSAGKRGRGYWRGGGTGLTPTAIGAETRMKSPSGAQSRLARSSEDSAFARKRHSAGPEEGGADTRFIQAMLA